MHRVRRHAPDGVAPVIGDKKRTGFVNRDAHWAPICIAVRTKEARKNIFRLTRRMPASNGTKITL